MLGGSSITDVDNYPHRAGQTGTKSMTIPRDTTGGPKEGGGRIKRGGDGKDGLPKSSLPIPNWRVWPSRCGWSIRPKGIRIDLVDDADFSMFSSAPRC
jgi:chemotaxis protein MotB